MHIYEHFCIIYSAFYNVLLSDSTYFGQRQHFNRKLFVILNVGSVFDLVSRTDSHSVVHFFYLQALSQND